MSDADMRDAQALGIVDWFIATVRARAGLRPLRAAERPRAWDYPPPPPPPRWALVERGRPLTRPKGPPTPPPAARDELAEAWRAISADWSRVVPRDVAVDQLALLIAERAELRAKVAVLEAEAASRAELLTKVAGLEAEAASLRSQLADRRGEYR